MNVTQTTAYPDADAAAYVFSDTAVTKVNENHSQELLQLCDQLNNILHDDEHDYAYRVGYAQVLVEKIESILKEQSYSKEK